ncbi:BQ5605_C003g02170 [Microbotryum silenes-dioicae]|uniref:BQ5605_C003g02170 protein n=1 Tax=Microbotryum silenes-dioicae TaxID=796604 RepID=A0A2X0P3I2_9BASI|nr:BQ5605_C003g02170 [Microbotryum silenes-dioicae]
MPDLSGKVIIVTESGYDLQWGTNVLGPYYFTKLLMSIRRGAPWRFATTSRPCVLQLPALKASKSASGTPSRVINTSSLAHGYAPTSAPNKVWEVDTFVGGGKRDALIKKWREYGARSTLYGQSKAGNIAHANYLRREHAGDIVACSLHPGMINSELQRHLPGFVASIVRWMSYPLTMGALTQLNTGTILTPEEINGKYYQPWGRVGHPTPQSIDPARADEAHQSCEAEFAKGKFRSPAGPIPLMPLK